MKLRILLLHGSVIVALGVMLPFTTGGVPCDSKQTPSTICHLHTPFDYGYPLCSTKTVSGPSEDINYGPGTDFIVTRVYTVPFRVDHYDWYVDNTSEVCLDDWKVHRVHTGTCRDYDISLDCTSGG